MRQISNLTTKGGGGRGRGGRRERRRRERREEEIVISFYSFDRDLRGGRDCNWRRAGLVNGGW